MPRTCFALFIFCSIGVAAHADGWRETPLAGSSFSIRDGGVKRTFEVAPDELGSIGADGRGAVEKAVPRASAEALRKAARVGRDFILYESGRAHTPFTRRWLTRRVLAKLADGADANTVAASVGAVAVERPDYARGLAIFDAPAGAGNALALAAALRAQPGVESAEPLLARQAKKRFTPDDPFFSDDAANAGYQWHLRNTGGRGGVAGVDLNVTAAWDNFRGAGVRIGILDDGLDLLHPDLLPNVDTVNDRDFNDNDNDPSPASGDIHGTAVAGLAAARGNNAGGVSGAAPEATLVALRLLGGPQSDVTEAAAFAWKNDVIEIKSNSWGPDDDGSTIEGPGVLANAAIQNGIATGRAGKGTLFFWAAGNGGVVDNANFDGYANSIYTSAVGVVTDAGTQAPYSESGANLLGVVPSDGGAQMLTTTDVQSAGGYNDGFTPGNFTDGNYTNDFGGTSAAAPLASGVAALVVQANPNLGWRDVQEILIRSATKIDAADAGWVNNGAAIHFNHKYGAGLLNASAAVALAPGWTNLGALTTLRKLDVIPTAIPDAPSLGLMKTFTFGAAENLRVEHATLTVDLAHAARGSLEIDLTSPSGTVSRLATQRVLDTAANLTWTFSSVRHWGESASGTWTVTVRDQAVGTTGTLNTVALSLFGSSPTSTSAPALTSATTASGNAGSPFSYQITATNAPNSYGAIGLPAGLSVNALTGFISGTVATAGAYPFTVSATNAFGTGTRNVTLTLATNLVANLADALDQPALAWNLDLSSPWTRVAGAAPTTHDGTDAARSATIADNGSTGFSLIAAGAQVIRFWWKVSSEAGFDFLHFDLDGTEQAAISGTVDWQQRGFIIPAGSHLLRWSYDKDVSTSAGSDVGWVDQVTFTPLATSAPVFTTEPSPLTVASGGLAAFVSAADGPGNITYQWRRNAINLAGATSRIYFISAAVAATHAGTYTCVATNANGSTTSLAATLTVLAADANIASAVDASALLWVKSGNNPQWVRNTLLAYTHDNTDSALATGLAPGASTTIATNVIGPGYVSFWWRSDGTADEDVIGYNLDGLEAEFATSTGGWAQVQKYVPLGLHTLSWTYYAGSAGSGFAGRGLLDQVSFAPTAYGTWQAAKFTAAQRIDDRISGPGADPDGDGIANLSEQFFALAPLTSGTAALPKLAPDGAGWAFTYQRDANATTTTRTIEHSTNLHAWTTVTASESILSINGTVQTLKATLPPESGPAHFYRFRLDLAE